MTFEMSLERWILLEQNQNSNQSIIHILQGIIY